jgi:hypothetical protein
MTSEMFERMPGASLPYAGTSGWSGTDASRERAERRDSNGQTATLQSRIVDNARHAGQWGITVKWLRDAYPDEHHGTLSGALTALHKTGRLLRLTEKRDKCSVYVAPQFLLGREAVPPKGRQRDRRLDEAVERLAAFLGACPSTREFVAGEAYDSLVTLRAEDLEVILRAVR